MEEFDFMKDTEHYRKKYLIPATLQRKVCMCEEPGPPSRTRRFMLYCSTCDKPYRWYVRICTECREHFIKDYRLELIECLRHTKCFDHLKNECTCRKGSTVREDFGPLGLNPRKVSQEERRNAFTFKGPFQGDK